MRFCGAPRRIPRHLRRKGELGSTVGRECGDHEEASQHIHRQQSTPLNLSGDKKSIYAVASPTSRRLRWRHVIDGGHSCPASGSRRRQSHLVSPFNLPGLEEAPFGMSRPASRGLHATTWPAPSRPCLSDCPPCRRGIQCKTRHSSLAIMGHAFLCDHLIAPSAYTMGDPAARLSEE